jgi:hypothetical protein
LKRGDRAVALLLGLLLAASAVPLLFSSSTAPRWAVVYVDGREWRRLPLDGPLEEVEVVLEGRRSLLSVGEGRARFVESSCPDGLCVHRGWLDGPGETALCLPNRIELRLEGKDDREEAVDGQTY